MESTSAHASSLDDDASASKMKLCRLGLFLRSPAIALWLLLASCLSS